ncbi:MAG: cytochrome ubiquinol oxidase subunit I, partial [Polyangiaceae bacterium]|nr:cytochrome ubiquinol oxidase subunit I [Polyangiaceae bacterium]
MDPLFLHRFQFAFTASFHYLFPQLTMGLALLIVVLKTMHIRGNEVAGDAARFSIRIFGLSFVMGVITGIPLEFQFGTNWSRFSEAAGGVIGQTLAMEGVFAFFLESTFLYALVFGERRFGPKMHYAASILLFIGSWASGWFIICTNAFMQYPVGYRVEGDALKLANFGEFFLSPWAFVQYAHTMTGALLTGSAVLAGIGALYALRRI